MPDVEFIHKISIQHSVGQGIFVEGNHFLTAENYGRHSCLNSLAHLGKEFSDYSVAKIDKTWHS